MNQSVDRNQAVALLVKEHGEYLYRQAYLRLGNRAAAEDAVQETFLSATDRYSDFRGDSSPRTWLMAILKNKCFDQLRKSGREQSWDSLLDEDQDLDAYFDTFGGWRGWFFRRWSASPESALEHKQFANSLLQCISKLPVSLRKLFSLKVLDQRSNQEICDAIGASAESVWTGMFRCRMHLRDCLERSWYKPLRERGKGHA